jgi:hypothetical protein
MKLSIQSLRLRDFRSFEDAGLDLDDTTILVGANNVGKTNILDAISLLAPERPLNMASDLRRHSRADTPSLEFLLEVKDPQRVPAYNFTFPTQLKVVKSGSTWEVFGADGSDLFPRANGTRYWRNSTANAVSVRGVTVRPGAIVSDLALPVPSTEATPLVEVKEEDAIKTISVEILNSIKKALPVVPEKWDPTEADFISEDNPIAAILTDKAKSLAISLLLNRAAANDERIGDYEVVLQKGIAAEIHTLCTRLTSSTNDLFKKNWHFKPAIQLTVTPAGPTLKLYFDQGASGVIEPKFTSDGLRWLVSFFIRLGMTDVRDQVLLFDQPGDRLYPGGQKDLVRLIEQLGQRNQVIYTTHSPFMISKSRLGRNVRIIAKPTDENGNQTGSSTVTNEIRETDIRQSDLLTDALGFYWTDFMPVGDFNVLMEGKLDSAIVVNTERQRAAQSGTSEIDFNRVVVRGVRGASNIEPEAKKLKGDGKRVLCIFDGDWKNPTPTLEGHERVTLTEIDPNWTDIEDLVPPEWIVAVIGQMKADTGIDLDYDKSQMTGPGSGRQLKVYFAKKEVEVGRVGLKDDFELRLIDVIQAQVNEGNKLPASFAKLASAIAKRLN